MSYSNQKNHGEYNSYAQLQRASPKSLRDEFAMAALNGILSNTDYCRELAENQISFGERAYWHADGMIAAREAQS